MKNFKVFAVISAVLIINSFASQSFSLDQAQEDEYAKARMLLRESKVEEARNIFAKLSKDDPSNFKVQLGTIDTDIEEIRILKAANAAAWKSKIYTPFGQLKGIFRANAASPDIYVSFAKCYWINNRFQKAERSLKKALHYKPDYSEALILKGDIYAEKSKEVRIDPFDEGKSQKENDHIRRIAVNAYKKVLSGNDVDTYTKAMVSYKLSKLFSYHGLKSKAAEQLNKTVELSPDSYWGVEAKKRLGAL